MRPGEERLRSGAGWLVGADWEQAWANFTTSAWRLETLPVYRVASEAEEFEGFLETGQLVDEEEPDAWRDKLRRWRAEGKQVGRVHTVTPPLGDYLRFEFAYYNRSVAAGEDVRILDFSRTPNPGLPAQDFWMFDDQLVVLMHYAEDGTQVGRETLTDVDPAPYVRYKELATSHSMEFMRYQELLNG